MKINHLIKLPLVLFAFSGFVACSSSSEVAQIQADYEAGNLTLEQRDAAIAAQREVERARSRASMVNSRNVLGENRL
jgi:hypothetical protein